MQFPLLNHLYSAIPVLPLRLCFLHYNVRVTTSVEPHISQIDITAMASVVRETFPGDYYLGLVGKGRADLR